MKEHPTHKGYFVTEDGRVFSAWQFNGRAKSYIDYSKLKELKGSICDCNRGYQTFTLKRKTYKGHRLIAETYIPNPHNLPEVNHKNKNRSDNRVENLEWVTNQQNNEHSKSKTYLIENLTNGEIFQIFNISKWSKENNLSYRKLLLTKKGLSKYRQHKGYRIISTP